jgi:pilus assembly protein FimV
LAIDSVATPSAPATSVDFDLGGGEPAAPAEQTDFAPTGTLIMDSKEAAPASSGLDFDLGGGDAAPARAAEAAPAPAESSGGLDFDLNLDLGGEPAAAPAADVDLSSISLDLGTPGEGGAVPDAKWQEVATKLDLAKAYEEMGDKDGARALLQEVAKDGDAAQKKQAEQMLSGLG